MAGQVHTSPILHLCKRCLILLSLSLMKNCKPLLPTSLHLRPLTLSSSQHPWPVEREHHGADRPLFIPGEMRCFWAALGPSPLIRPFHKLHCHLLGLYPQPRGLLNTVFPHPFFFILFYLFTEALPRVPLMRNSQI